MTITIPYNKYLTIRNKYCVCYYGPYNEFILQLIYLKPIIEKQLTGLELYISCKDEIINFLPKSDFILPRSNTENYLFAYVRNLAFDNVNHPIECFLKESKIILSKQEIKELTEIIPSKDQNSLILLNLFPNFKIFECY